MKVPFSYLDRQFADVDLYLAEVRNLVLSGDFTLGKVVTEFEEKFASLCKMPYAIGVGSGTDAIILSLKMVGVGPGDEVITAANTFIATVGAIAMTGAKPVLVDSDEGFCIDPSLIEAAITPNSKAILPVHFTGNVANMQEIMRIAEKHNLIVLEDACQAISGTIDGKPVGSWGETAAFSLHPLKNLNVWGDGGVIVTKNEELSEKLKLFRNHGLVNRDEVKFFGHNSRLDSLQAVIGNRIIEQTNFITTQKIANAKRLDEGLADLEGDVSIPARSSKIKHVYHLYIIRVKRRDELLRYLVKNEIEAKIHYPIPLHLQEACSDLGYREGSFPVSENDSAVSITLPAHQHLTDAEIDYMLDKIHAFYRL
jgi:aminotransferase EvaB